MAVLQYKKNQYDSILYICESDRDRLIHADHWFDNRQAAFFSNEKDDSIQISNLLTVLGISDLSACEKVNDDTYILAKNINPYIMKINWKSFLYFGDDMPIVKSKTVKNKTKHYMFWNDCYGYKENKPETYFYVKVKHPEKLFSFYSCFYDFVKGERILEFNEKPNSGIRKEAYFDYIAKMDYSDEVYQKLISEKIKKELEERNRREEYARIKEEHKRTPGYCSCCGAEHAHLTVNPFNVEYYNDFTPVWLCNMCYESYLGDI